MNIYVLGDVASFVAALNSVVMVLGVQSFVSGAAMIGALVGLLSFLIFLTNKDAGQSVIPGGSPIVALIVFFVFFTSIGIKTRVTITDVYTGNTNVVNNVPVLISMPATAISTAAYKVFDYSNTAFQSANGSFLALGATGYVAPLQILQTLRNGMESIDPLLAATTRQFIVDCVPGGSLNPENFAAAPDALTYVLTYARDNGLTTSFTTAAPTGTATSCAQAKAELATRSQNLLSQNDAKYGNKPKLVAIVNQHLKQKNPGGAPVSAAAIEESVQRVILDGLAGTTQTPNQFMLNALFYNTLTNTFNCLDQAADQSTFNSCDVMMTQASEQWKTDSAAAGSLFAKTMMPAMVFMQLMFYSLAPIVLIFGLLRGAGAIGMYVKFLGFGVWTASWMPVAAVIQMYIQNNVGEKLAQISNKALTPGNFKAIYYDVISTNLAIASDMLAATPLVTATILGVSGMAMTQLANNMGGKDRVDEKLMSPDLVKGSPIVQSSSMSEVNSSSGIATKTGAAAPKLSYNAANSASMASANSIRATEQASSSAELSKSLVASEGRMLAAINSNATTHSESGSVSWRTTDGQSISFGSGATSAQVNSAAAKAAVNAEAAMQLGAQIQAAVVPGFIKALAAGGKNVSAKEAEGLIAKSATQASAKDAGFMSRLTSGDADAIGTLVEGAVGLASVAGTLTTGPVGAGAAAAAQIALRSGGKKAIVAGVQKAIGAVSGASDRLQGVSSAIFDNTRAGAQATMKAAISTSSDLQHLNSDQKDQVARALTDWSRQDTKSGDVTDARTRGKTNSDSSTVSTTATVGEAFKTATIRAATADQAYQRNAQQAIDSGVRFDGTADQFAQFLRSNPSVAKDLENRIQQMEPVISGDAAKMRQLIDNSVRSGMSEKERDLVAGAMALAGVDRGFNPMTSRDPVGGLQSDSNANLPPPTNVGTRADQAEQSVPQPGQVQTQKVVPAPPASGVPYSQTAAMVPAARPVAPFATAQAASAMPAQAAGLSTSAQAGAPAPAQAGAPAPAPTAAAANNSPQGTAASPGERDSPLPHSGDTSPVVPLAPTRADQAVTPADQGSGEPVAPAAQAAAGGQAVPAAGPVQPPARAATGAAGQAAGGGERPVPQVASGASRPAQPEGTAAGSAPAPQADAPPSQAAASATQTAAPAPQAATPAPQAASQASPAPAPRPRPKSENVSRNPAQARTAHPSPAPAPAPAAASSPAPAAATRSNRTTPGGVTPGGPPNMNALRARQQALMPGQKLAEAVQAGPASMPLTAPDATKLSVKNQMDQTLGTEFGAVVATTAVAGAAINVLSGLGAPTQEQKDAKKRGAGKSGTDAPTVGGTGEAPPGSAPGAGHGGSQQPSQRRDGAVLTGGSGRPARRRR